MHDMYSSLASHPMWSFSPIVCLTRVNIHGDMVLGCQTIAMFGSWSPKNLLDNIN